MACQHERFCGLDVNASIPDIYGRVTGNERVLQGLVPKNNLQREKSKVSQYTDTVGLS
jgi:hypothetical protein